MKLEFHGRSFDCRQGESVLEALLRQGASPPFSCRNGSCLACLQRCTAGTPTEASQRALRPSLRQAGYFLPCKCRPDEDMSIMPPRATDLFSPAVVVGKELLADDVCVLRLESATSLDYHAGQFINLRRPDGLTRSYSLASLPSEDEHLEIHVKRMSGGAMSAWLCDRVSVGDELEYQGPNGSTHYVPRTEPQDLLLVGNGTGAAPLIGIVRDALHVDHRGSIRIFLGSRTTRGLYLHETFSRIAATHPRVEYVPCVSGSDVPVGFAHGRVDDVVRTRISDMRGTRLFVAGLPAMVSAVERWARAEGASPSEIHADAYEVRPLLESVAPTPMAPQRAEGSPERGPASDPDSEIWLALDQGRKLSAILADFYGVVFEDEILSPYFAGVTKERVIGQVFSFMRDHFTGERKYFGLRPRTGHHWMVISDAIFDHRERLMRAALLRGGLAEPLIERWLRFEEGFREHIVKATPWPLVVNGVEMPLDGFGEEELTSGTLCDGCGRAIEAGERVGYHLRLGRTYCRECRFTNRSGESAHVET